MKRIICLVVLSCSQVCAHAQTSTTTAIQPDKSASPYCLGLYNSYDGPAGMSLRVENLDGSTALNVLNSSQQLYISGASVLVSSPGSFAVVYSSGTNIAYIAEFNNGQRTDYTAQLPMVAYSFSGESDGNGHYRFAATLSNSNATAVVTYSSTNSKYIVETVPTVPGYGPVYMANNRIYVGSSTEVNTPQVFFKNANGVWASEQIGLVPGKWHILSLARNGSNMPGLLLVKQIAGQSETYIGMFNKETGTWNVKQQLPLIGWNEYPYEPKAFAIIGNTGKLLLGTSWYGNIQAFLQPEGSPIVAGFHDQTGTTNSFAAFIEKASTSIVFFYGGNGIIKSAVANLKQRTTDGDLLFTEKTLNNKSGVNYFGWPWGVGCAQ